MLIRPRGPGRSVPLCRKRMFTSTQASTAVDMPPVRAKKPEKRNGSAPAADTPAASLMHCETSCREHGSYVATVSP